MQRQEVTIDGVKLTREQIERAYTEINTPQPLVIRSGTSVSLKHTGDIVTVINPCSDVLRVYRSANARRGYGDKKHVGISHKSGYARFFDDDQVEAILGA
jgi:hypothetical protein